MSLIDKIRKARESVVEVDGKKYTIRRPTEAEQSEIYRNGGTTLEMVQRFVVGWELQEIDLIEGGDPVAVTFSSELWAEYVSDHVQLLAPLSTAIRESIAAHNEKVERAEKK